MTYKLAELLLRRKELNTKVEILKSIKDRDLFEVKCIRRAAAEGIDDIVANVPLLVASQVTAEHDWHARQLRRVDASIQQANWTTEVEVDAEAMQDYEAPELKRD